MEKMDRISFLRQSALLTGSAFLGASCSSGDSQTVSQNQSGPNIISHKTYTWKMVTTWPPNFPVLGEGCNLFAKWVEEMSGGRMKIQVFGGGELVPALEAFEAVSNGISEIGNGASYYWAGKVPEAQFFSTVPFGMNAQQMNAWINNGGGLKLWEDTYAPFNLRPVPAGNTGVQMGGWFNKEINSLADLQGLKMRIPGLGGKVLTKAGGSAINVAGGEIYTNLERGVIDATEWIGPYHDYLIGFHKISKYYYYPGWHEPGTVLETFFNTGKLESLPADLQAILITAAHRQNLWIHAEFEAKNNIYLEKIKAESDAQIRVFPTDVLSRLRELTGEVVAELVEGNQNAQKIYESYQNFRKGAQNWSRLTEKIYYDQLQMS